MNPATEISPPSKMGARLGLWLCLWLVPGLAAWAGDAGTPSVRSETAEGRALRDALVRAADQPGKPAWRPMLLYLAELHGRSVHPPVGHFPRPFEEIGPGYQGGLAFGHIDLTHERLDTVRAAPAHARDQIRNELAGQQKDGLVPGVISIDPSGKLSWKDFKGFPPLWVVSVDAYLDATGDVAFLPQCLDALVRQIAWFEARRSVADGGFSYLDATTGPWESGVDEGIRYDDRPPLGRRVRRRKLSCLPDVRPRGRLEPQARPAARGLGRQGRRAPAVHPEGVVGP